LFDILRFFPARSNPPNGALFTAAATPGGAGVLDRAARQADNLRGSGDGALKNTTAATLVAVGLAAWPGWAGTQVAVLDPPDTVPGYVARLLINEVPFPGEHRYVSEQDSQAAMLAILWVVHSRIHHIPPGYSQEQVAAIRSQDILDVITAGGEKGQCDGFYRDSQGRPRTVPRVEKRIQYLLGLANRGGQPGRFARLLNYAQGLAAAYVREGIRGADRYASLYRIGRTEVTGRAYSWMSDQDYYQPGGSFVKIPDENQGSLGGNRFFSLKRRR